MNKLIFIVILLTGLNGFLSAQTVLIKQTVPEDFSTVDNNRGPNRRHFSFPYFGMGWHIGEVSHQSDTILAPSYLQSLEMRFGTRGKLKLNGLLALGTDVEISYAVHRLSIDDPYIQSILPSTTQKAKYQLYKTGGLAYIQINLKPRRGNQLGTYIDLGGYGNYNFGRRLTVVTSNSNSKETTKITQKKLEELHKLEYGALLRYGQNTWAIYGKYRYSNSFKNMKHTNLPRLTIGFEYFFGNV